MTPILLAAMGGVFTELSGMLNIALEGLLMMGAFCSIVLAYYTGSIFIGVLLGIALTMLLAALLGFIALFLKANVFIAGLATNLLAAGLSVVLSFHLFGNKGVVEFDSIPALPVFKSDLLSRIPVVNEIFNAHTIFVYISWIMLFLCWFLLYRTAFGFRLTAAGKHEKTLISLGLSPRKYRFIAFVISGFTCGVGGALLTLNMGAFIPNISAGKGWIALVVIFLGYRRPLGLLVAAFIFGFADAFSNYAQGALNVPADFVLAIPYFFTLLAMIVFSIFEQRRNAIQ
jgi:simple sugar transport system permease protein